jgi:hypothetical protein
MYLFFSKNSLAVTCHPGWLLSSPGLMPTASTPTLTYWAECTMPGKWSQPLLRAWLTKTVWVEAALSTWTVMTATSNNPQTTTPLTRTQD